MLQVPQPRGRVIRSYDLYGVHVASDHDFVNPIPVSPRPAHAAQLVFRCCREEPEGADWSTAEIVDEQGQQPDGRPDFVFARLGTCDAIRIPGALDCYLRDDEILCHLLDERHAYLVEIVLLGLVLAFWLERTGTPTLHASAVTVDGHAVAFLGTRGGGKTSTLAGCLERGHALLADDLLALREDGEGFIGERGYPALRLWPEQADRFLGHHADLPILHPDFSKRRVVVGPGTFGRFAEGPARLRRLYLPERHDDPAAPVELERLPSDQALIALLRHSFLPREVQLFGWQPRRLPVLARLAGSAPVVRLRYPSGFDLLPGVLAELEHDIRSGDAPVS